jgi:prolyl 4-hydroxylase
LDKQITKDWKDWIELNVSRGCDKDGIYKILLDEGFSPIDIEKEMGHVPQMDVATIVNPLKTEQRTEFTEDFHFEKNSIYIPNAQKLDTELAEFYTLPNFLNSEECDQVTELIKKKLRPSTIAADGEADESYRTSRTCDLGEFSDPLIADIDRRICSLLGIHPSYSEITQGQYYKTDEEFKVHTDFFEGPAFEEHARERGQRTFTFMVYLNDVESGGETEFIRLKQTIKPKKGMAIIWNSLNEDGSNNYNTLHQAHPVRSGVKSIITKWFRTKGQGPMFTKEPNEYIPNYTQVGFKKEKLDGQLFEKILKFYTSNQENNKPEFVEGGFVEIEETGEYGSDVIELPDELRKEIHNSLKPQLEAWSKTELIPTFVYGIRIYKKGSVLISHRDKLKTHIISAIINVDQEVEEEWPIIIDDNYYRKHQVFLNPGEIVFYESARLIHGRPLPLKGNKFANIFCHFMPVNMEKG